MFTAQHLREIGFEGFLLLDGFDVSVAVAIPPSAGVYCVSCDAFRDVAFSDQGTGGFFKGKNPNVAVAHLKERWNVGAEVLYFGKAHADSVGRGLRKRVLELVAFGQGRPIAHWGGRYLWQIADRSSLRISWLETKADPRDVERQFIRDFANHFGQRPFANIQG